MRKLHGRIKRECEKIVSKTIRRMRRHGKPQKQAVAIGLSVGRSIGCPIPKKK